MIGDIRHVVLCYEDEIVAPWKRRLVCPVDLSQEPFHPVASDGAPDLSARRDTDPGVVALVGGGHDDEVFGYETSNLGLLSPFEIDPLPQSLPWGESLIRHQTDRRFRPLALLRLMTSLPPLVRIRTRKPCVRLRLVLCG